MQRFRTVMAVIVVCLSLRLLIGCGGGNGNGGASGPTGTVESWAFVQGGTVVLNSSSAAPAGATALSAATVTIDGHSGNTSTDSAGHFLISGVPIGQRKAHITPSGGAGGVVEAPLTVLASTTIRPGTYTVSRQQAIDLAKTALAGYGTIADFRVLAPQQPLPSGTVITPALGDDNGQPDPALAYTVPSPQWLIYGDALSGQRFQHQVYFVLIDAITGTVTTRLATSWPRINTVSMYADDDANETAQDLVQAGTRMVVITRAQDLASGVRRAVSLSGKTRDHVPGATDPKTVALLIDGNSRSDMATDLDNVQANLFGANGLSGPSSIHTWSPPLSGTVDAEAQVKSLFNQACAEARPEDTLLIYITSHGSKTGAIYLQQGVESDESTTQDAVIFPYLDLDTSKCPACHVILIIDACYSGEAMVDMDVHTPPHAGQKRTTIVASSSAETSGGVTKVINIKYGRTMGGVFTNAFLDSLKTFSQAHGGAHQSDLQNIFDGAVTNMNSSTQHPQTVFRWDGQMCGAAPSLIRVTPTSVTATHTVGVTPCPEDLSNISIQNVSTNSVSYSASLNSSYFTLSGYSGSLSVGQSKSLGLSFNCGHVPPLSASLSISASYGTQSQQVNIPITLRAGP